MDLSILKGSDPAGYKAEAMAAARAAGGDGSAPRLHTKASISGTAESGQFHVYRKTRRREHDRMAAFEAERAAAEEDGLHRERTTRATNSIQERTAKRRAKRASKAARRATAASATRATTMTTTTTTTTTNKAQ